MAGLLSLLLAVAAWSGTVEHRTGFGSMTLIQEEWTRDPSQPPMIHAPNAWKKLHLRWQAPDGDLTVALVDNGRILQIDTSGHGCLRSAYYYGYGRKTGEPLLWRAMTGELRAFATACPRVPAMRAAAYAKAFAGTRDDFVAGVEALKKRAVTVVATNLARCSPPKEPFLINPDPYADRCGPMR